VAQVVFQGEAMPVVAVHPCLCASNLYMDSLLCHCSKDGSRPFDFHKPLLGVFAS
jgi:hypothetical protein